jgi:hypothetical protein
VCFERLTAGQTVPVMEGPQGGFHLWTAVGCAECAATEHLRIGVKDPATGDYLAGTGPFDLMATLDSSGWHQAAGFTAFLPGAPWDETSILPEGTHVVLSAELRDADDTIRYADEREVVLGKREIWSPPCDPDPNTCGAIGGLPCCTDGP